MTSEQEDVRLVHVATAPKAIFAGMWSDLLLEEGVIALVQPLGPGPGAWGSAATFEHALSVRTEDTERAEEVLRGIAPDPVPPVEHINLDLRTHSAKPRPRFAVIALIVIAVMMVIITLLSGRTLFP